MKIRHYIHEVPVFEARVQLIVSDNIHKERQKRSALFGPIEHGPIYNGLCSWSGGHNFALFFEPPGLTHRIVAHETMHLTHRILEWVGTPFLSNNHEIFCLLNGHLHSWIYSCLGKEISSDSKERKLRKSR